MDPEEVVSVDQVPNGFVFVCDSQDTQEIQVRLNAQEYDSFFVLAGDGDYEVVYGMVGSVPLLSKVVTRLV